MKSLILISSIFYILGLKVGHKIDLFKSRNPIEKISTTTKAVKSATKAIYFGDANSSKSKTDSVKVAESVKKSSPEKHL